MEQLINNIYKIHNPDIGRLKSLGFKYDSRLSNSEHSIYYRRFPVHKYNEYVTLECELSVDSSNGNVDINVYDENNEMYHPFYHIECGNYDTLMKKINNKIRIELKKIGIIKVGTCK